MSKIKFRAWNKNFEEYSEVATIDFMNNDVWIVDPDLGSVNLMDFSEVVIEQYTGRNDKNGIEIYVGDEVAVDYGHEIIVLVVDDMSRLPMIDAYSIMGLEVIGNVHE